MGGGGGDRATLVSGFHCKPARFLPQWALPSAAPCHDLLFQDRRNSLKTTVLNEQLDTLRLVSAAERVPCWPHGAAFYAET